MNRWWWWWICCCWWRWLLLLLLMMVMTMSVYKQLSWTIGPPWSLAHAGASIPTLAYEAFLPVSEKSVGKSIGKTFPNTLNFSRQNFSLYPPKFLMTFLVIEHYFQIFRFPAVNVLLYHPISPFLFNFPLILQIPPYFSYLLTLNFLPLKSFYISFPLNWQKHLFPPKMPNFPPKIGMKISASFPPWEWRPWL